MIHVCLSAVPQAPSITAPQTSPHHVLLQELHWLSTDLSYLCAPSGIRTNSVQVCQQGNKNYSDYTETPHYYYYYYCFDETFLAVITAVSLNVKM